MKSLPKLISYLQDHGIISDVVSVYGEPGYSLEKGQRGILLGNWNDVAVDDRLRLEKHYALEWGDEWMVDGDKAWRTSPDSYGWTPSFVLLDDGTVLTTEALTQSALARERYINEYLLNNPHHADVFDLHGTLGYLGFELHNGHFASGLHPGDNDKPEEVFARLRGRYDVVFQVSGKDQFTVNWLAWVRER